jgi:tRNA uridine 5-carboxymethylaminomethyl modification enzyme
MATLVGRPELGIKHLVKANAGLESWIENTGDIAVEITEQAEIQMKYEGYISREKDMADKQKRLEDLIIHDDFEYMKLTSLSAESRQKLEAVRPKTIGQASRISGVSPADISILLIYLGR